MLKPRMFALLLILWSLVMLLTLSGCVWPPDAQKWIAQEQHYTVKVNMSPFSSTLGENFNLVWCTDADDAIVTVGKRMHEYQALLNNKDLMSRHPALVGPLQEKVRTLQQWILMIAYWQRDNCTEASLQLPPGPHPLL